MTVEGESRPDSRSPHDLEADVRGGEASALPCFYRDRPDGRRRERGLFLIISVSSEAGVYRLSAGARVFLAPACASDAAFLGC